MNETSRRQYLEKMRELRMDQPPEEGDVHQFAHLLAIFGL
jgi:hypothetical protein